MSASPNVFAIGFAFAAINTAISAMQPVIMRYGALNIDPLVFCAGTVGFAACGAVAMLAWSGELRMLLVNRTYLPGCSASRWRERSRPASR